MSEKVNQNLIFNPSWDDSVANRTIIKWNTTWLFNLNDVKYQWARNMYQVMVWNFWLPEKVSGLWEDAIQYQKELTDDERRAYDGIISFLTFLDSIQTMNVPNINNYITSPEVNIILAIQAFQEAIHSQSYATIIESVVSSKDRARLYYFWRDDEHLLERNKFVWDIYQKFIDHPNDENLFETMVANFLLESIYFYNGFAFFDTLADQWKMVATDRMINYIRRDELTHVTLFANILNEIKVEFPEIYSEKLILDHMRIAIEQEISWSTHILGSNIIGMSPENVKWYTHWLANERLALLGIKPLFPEVKENPYAHLERLQDNNMEKWNFFESTVTNYTQSSSMKWDWEF